MHNSRHQRQGYGSFWDDPMQLTEVMIQSLSYCFVLPQGRTEQKTTKQCTIQTKHNIMKAQGSFLKSASTCKVVTSTGNSSTQQHREKCREEGAKWKGWGRGGGCGVDKPVCLNPGCCQCHLAPQWSRMLKDTENRRVAWLGTQTWFHPTQQR